MARVYTEGDSLRAKPGGHSDRAPKLLKMIGLSLFLKRVLVIDAAGCLTMGPALVWFAPVVAEPIGLGVALIGGAGLLLIPPGLIILWLGTRTAAPGALVYVVIAANFIWTAASLVIALHDTAITPLGSRIVAVQGMAAFSLAWLELIGVWRSFASRP